MDKQIGIGCNMLLTLLINGFRVPMFINMLITRLGIISPKLALGLRDIRMGLGLVPDFFLVCERQRVEEENS